MVENTKVQKEVILRVDSAIGDQRFSDAFMIAKPYADMGIAWAEACLGSLYFCGLGVERDLRKAKEYLDLAASQGHGGAWYTLGVLYQQEGDGLQADEQMSQRCFEKARDLDYVLGKPLPEMM